MDELVNRFIERLGDHDTLLPDDGGPRRSGVRPGALSGEDADVEVRE